MHEQGKLRTADLLIPAQLKSANPHLTHRFIANKTELLFELDKAWIPHGLRIRLYIKQMLIWPNTPAIVRRAPATSQYLL